MEVSDIFSKLMEAFNGGDWALFASLCVVAVVWLLTHEKSPLTAAIKGPARVWVAAVCGVVGAIAVAVSMGTPWPAAIMNGLAVGTSATGVFELIKRTVAKKPIDADKDGKLDELK